MRIGIGEMLVVFLIALVVIGPDKLPEYARQLGKALSELKKTTAGLNDEIKKEVITPLSEAAQPLKEAVDPINESMSQIKSDMNKVSKTIENPAAAMKDAVKNEMRPVDEAADDESAVKGAASEEGLT